MATEIDRIAERTEEYGSSVSWGAIFCGAFIIIGVQLLFTFLGSAIGLSAFNPVRGESIGTVWAGIYFLVTMIISFYFGGYVASRLAGFKYRSAALLHSLCSWALVTALFAYLVTSGIGSLVGGAFSIAGSVAGTGAQIMSQGTHEKAGQVAKDPVGTLSRELGISRADAQKIYSQAQSKMSHLKSPQGQQQMKQAAGQVTKAAAGGAWLAFITFLLCGIAALLGGLVGDVFHARRYERAERRAAA